MKDIARIVSQRDYYDEAYDEVDGINLRVIMNQTIDEFAWFEESDDEFEDLDEDDISEEQKQADWDAV